MSDAINLCKIMNDAVLSFKIRYTINYDRDNKTAKNWYNSEMPLEI